MASNQRKEQIRVEWSTNYQNAIQQIEQVKKSVSDNASELENLNRVQKQLEDNFKGFESTLEFVAKQTTDNEYANKKLTEAIEKLEKQIGEVDTKLNALGQSLNDVAKANDKVADSVDDVTKANDKASKSIDKSKDSTKDLSDTNKDLTQTTQATNDTTAQSSVLFQRLDEVSFGLASNFRDLIGANGGVKQAIFGNAEAFAQMTTKAKIATVATNGAKLALRALATATIIGALVVALGYVIENWDEINSKIKGAFNETYRLNQLELEKIKLQKEQLALYDNQTEQLKRQGYTELEILKIKQKQILDNIKLIVRENQLKRENELAELTFMEQMQRWGDYLYGVLQGVASVGVTVFETIQNINRMFDRTGKSGEVSWEKTQQAWKTTGESFNARQNIINRKTGEYENSDEYKSFMKELENQREAYASISNQIDNFGKKTNTSLKKMTNDSAKILAEHLAKVETARKLLDAYKHDTDALNADNVFLKKQADWEKREYDSNEKLRESLKTLGEAHKENSSEYIKGKEIIENYHNSVIAKIDEEKKAYKNLTPLLFETQSAIESGNLSLDEQKKLIDDFLSNITDADVKEEWSKLLGVEQLEQAISFMENYKAEMKDFTIDDSDSFNNNNNKLQEIKDFNLSLLDEERATALARADELELSEENRLKIIEKFKKQQNEIESNYNEASKELNVKRATQISEYADVAGQGLSALGSLMSENFTLNKSIAVADAVINSFAAINGTLASMSSTNPYLAIATSIAIGLQGFANVVSILKTTPENASAQSAPAMANLEGAKNMPNVSFQQSGESQLAQTINNQDTPIVKAIVVAKDVTAQQEKDSIKKNNSSL